MIHTDISKRRLELTASRARRRHPDHQLNAIYPACWPIYRIRLSVNILEQSRLPIVASHILNLVDSDVCKIGELAKLLCLPENYIAGASAELLRTGLVEQKPNLQITVTNKGKDALGCNQIKITKAKPLEIPFDSITRMIPNIDVEELLNQNAVNNEGMFVIQYASSKPGPGDLRLGEIRRYYSNIASKDHYDIIGISDIGSRSARLQYRNIDIVKLSHPNTDASVFLAYSGYQYLEEETHYLQQLAERGINLVPDEFERSVSIWDVTPNVSSDEESIMREVNDLYIAAEKIRQDAAESNKPRGTKPNQIKPTTHLTGLKNDPLAEQIAKSKARLNKITNNSIRLIKTEEHHDLLLNAIDQATKELTLVSAWIDPYTFDGEVREKLAAAVKRGVTVRIAWGLGVNGNRIESERNKRKGEKALDMLRKLLTGNTAGSLIIRRTNTHEKFIICDDKFCVCGSFNWLSYRGSIDRGYRRETSMYSTRSDDINLWKENASTLFQTTDG